jgi:hemin uptake protein HemP
MTDSGTEGPAAAGPSQSGPSPATGESAGAAASLPKIIPFSSLVRCGDEVWIEHAGSLYRLRRTKQDKLILTK